jgi:hypothetical protein
MDLSRYRFEMKGLMDELAARHEPFLPIVDGWFGSTLRYRIIAEDHLGMLFAAKAAITGLGADCVVLTADAYLSNTDIHPITGQHWKPGELAELVETLGGDATIVEGLIVTAQTQCSLDSMTLPYIAHPREGRVDWLNDDRWAVRTGIKSGRIPAVLQEAFDFHPSEDLSQLDRLALRNLTITLLNNLGFDIQAIRPERYG